MSEGGLEREGKSGEGLLPREESRTGYEDQTPGSDLGGGGGFGGQTCRRFNLGRKAESTAAAKAKKSRVSHTKGRVKLCGRKTPFSQDSCLNGRNQPRGPNRNLEPWNS